MKNAKCIASIVIPGLGQILAGSVRRGLLILASMISLLGLCWWRFTIIARGKTELLDIVKKVFQLNGGFLVLVMAGIAGIWIWNVFDAWAISAGKKKNGIFALILLIFFTVGWQISEIDVIQLATQAGEAWKPLSRILWPGDAAVTYNTTETKAGAEILGDSEENPPPYPVEVEGEPFLLAEPNFGYLSKMDSQGSITPGTTIHLTGRGFHPNTETRIWWIDPQGNEFQPRHQGTYLSVVTDEKGEFSIDMVMPYRLIPPTSQGQQIHRVEARQVFQVGGALPSEPLKLTIVLMIETIFMGMMATFFGIILSIPVSFLAARNLMSGSKITMAIYYITRTILNIIRAIEPLIWALIAVVWVGLGPFAGIVALTIHSIAALGKLYSEAIEGIDPGPIEAIQATGATKLQTIMFAVVPQMIPPFVSFTIYRWDINVRMSTVIGMVGGGGIGFLLVQYIRLLDYKAAGIAVWFIAVTVAILDYVSAEIRARFT